MALTPRFPTNQWLMTGMKMAEVMVSTLTSKKRRFCANKTNFLATFKHLWRRTLVKLTKNTHGPTKEKKRLGKGS